MTSAARWRAAVATLALAPASVLAACALPPQAGTRLGDTELQLAWRAQPAPIVAQRPFALRLRLCPAHARLLRVDATMPAHGHGMNYRVALLPQGGGDWLAEGLLWHMSGRWELRFEIELDGRPRELRQEVLLP